MAKLRILAYGSPLLAAGFVASLTLGNPAFALLCWYETDVAYANLPFDVVVATPYNGVEGLFSCLDSTNPSNPNMLVGYIIGQTFTYLVVQPGECGPRFASTSPSDVESGYGNPNSYTVSFIGTDHYAYQEHVCQSAPRQ
jgi:hypothetical protein